MTQDRARAYRRVIQTFDEVGPANLAASEQELIRRAVDELIFSRDLLEDDHAQEALKDVGQLCRVLAESGRWKQANVTRLAEHISQCGPPPPAELEAA